MAETWSIQKIDDYITFVQNDDSLDDQKKNDIYDNLLDVRNLREELDNKKQSELDEQAKNIEQNEKDKEDQKEADLQQVDELKKLLAEKDEKIDTMQNDIDSLREELRKISDKNHDALETLKDAKKSQDQEVIKTQREMIVKLIQEKRALRDKYA